MISIKPNNSKNYLNKNYAHNKTLHRCYSSNSDDDLAFFYSPFDSNPLSYPVHKEVPFFLNAYETTKKVCLMYLDIQLNLMDCKDLNTYFFLSEKIKKEQNKQIFDAQYYAFKNLLSFNIIDEDGVKIYTEIGEDAKSPTIHAAFILHASLYLVINFLSSYLDVDMNDREMDFLREEIRELKVGLHFTVDINEIILDKKIDLLKKNLNLKEIAELVVLLFSAKDRIELKILTDFLNILKENNNDNKVFNTLNFDGNSSSNDAYIKDCKKIFSQYNLIEDPKNSKPLTLQHHLFSIIHNEKFKFTLIQNCWIFMLLAQIIYYLELREIKIKVEIPPLLTSSIILDFTDEEDEYMYLGYIFTVLTGIFTEAIINYKQNKS